MAFNVKNTKNQKKELKSWDSYTQHKKEDEEVNFEIAFAFSFLFSRQEKSKKMKENNREISPRRSKRRTVHKIAAANESNLFHELPDDLVVSVLCKLSSSAASSSDFINALLTYSNYLFFWIFFFIFSFHFLFLNGKFKIYSTDARDLTV